MNLSWFDLLTINNGGYLHFFFEIHVSIFLQIAWEKKYILQKNFWSIVKLLPYDDAHSKTVKIIYEVIENLVYWINSTAYLFSGSSLIWLLPIAEMHKHLNGIVFKMQKELEITLFQLFSSKPKNCIMKLVRRLLIMMEFEDSL